jgi:hypothetical protein
MSEIVMMEMMERAILSVFVNIKRLQKGGTDIREQKGR